MSTNFAPGADWGRPGLQVQVRVTTRNRDSELEALAIMMSPGRSRIFEHFRLPGGHHDNDHDASHGRLPYRCDSARSAKTRTDGH